MPTEGPTIRCLVLMGVSGSGKTTVGRLLARTLGWDFADGDDFHPAENVRKMAAGTPLDDKDRQPWLMAIRREIDRRSSADQPVVIACSALKAAYRDLLVGSDSGAQVVFLKGTFETIEARLRQREGHFMPIELLRSQFEALELPESAWVVDITDPPRTLVRQIVDRLNPGNAVI